MTPAYGRFANRQAVALRKKQQFRIESKTERGLFLENTARPLAIKKFEPALRIMQAEPQQQANHEIENDSAKFAQARLMFFDISAIEAPGTDNHVNAVTNRNLEQLGQFFNWRGKVSIGKQDILA